MFVGGSVGAEVLVVVSVDGAVLVVVDESAVGAADVVETALVLVVAVGADPTAVLLVAVGSPGSALPPMVVVVEALATGSPTAPVTV